MEINISRKKKITLIDINEVICFEVQDSTVIVSVEHVWFTVNMLEIDCMEINYIISQIKILYSRCIFDDLILFSRQSFKRPPKAVVLAQELAKIIHQKFYETPTHQASG